MDSENVSIRRDPYLVGSTGTFYNTTIATTAHREIETRSTTGNPHLSTSNNVLADEESNYFKNTQWSPDGTTLLTTSADNTLRTFVLPPTLLSPPHPVPLTPYTTHPLPSPPYALTTHPAYTLSSPPTTLILLSLSSLPVRLLSPFSSPSPSKILASYPLVSPTTEAFIAPHSLLFDETYSSSPRPSSSSSGGCTNFFAGADSEVCVFDMSRDGEGPVARMPTIPSRRKKIVGGGVGFKGIVGALGMAHSTGVLAAGCLGGWVGMYDSGGRGGVVGVFENSKTEEVGMDDGSVVVVGEGCGVTQVVWSACGRYLVVVERGSDGVGVWDIRGTGKRLAWLTGRRARTMQRLRVDMWGEEVWAGGTDGRVRVWEGGVGRREGVVEPSWGFEAHGDAVSSAVLHPTGTVLATCSGQRHLGERVEKNWESEDDESEESSSGSSVGESVRGEGYDNSLKVWAL